MSALQTSLEGSLKTQFQWLVGLVLGTWLTGILTIALTVLLSE
jgi:hypothetical protein